MNRIVTNGIVLVLFLLVFSAGQVYADVKIIANKSVNVEQLTEAEIKDIFLGDKRLWDNNERIRFFTLTDADADVQKVFLKKYIKKSPSQYLNYWRKQLFTGKGAIPESYSEEQLLKKVMETPGAIGFVSEKSLSNNEKALNIKFISVVDS